MRLLLRLAFWLSVVAIFLPRSETQPASATQVSASQAVSAATATVTDMAKFCDRQPQACTVGTHAAEELSDRAREGAKRLYEMFNEKLVSADADRMTAAPPSAKSIPLPTARPARGAAATARNVPPTAPQAPSPQAPSPQAASQNTLTPADIAPLWRGPIPRRDPREPV
jgi:hypothetical protein